MPDKTYRFEYKEQYEDNINWLENHTDLLTPSQLDVLEVCRTAKIIQRSKHVLWANCLRMLKDSNYLQVSLMDINKLVDKNESIRRTLRASYLRVLKEFSDDTNATILRESIVKRVPVNQRYEKWTKVLNERHV